MNVASYIVGMIISGIVLLNFKDAVFEFRGMATITSGDDLVKTFTHGMYYIVVLVYIAVIFIFLRNLFCTVIALKYGKESCYENKLLRVVDILSSLNAELIRILAGILFGSMGAFSIIACTENPSMVDGNPMALYVVGGAFVLFGCLMIFFAIRSMIKTIKRKNEEYREYADPRMQSECRSAN